MSITTNSMASMSGIVTAPSLAISGSQCGIRVVSTIDDFDALEKDWNALLPEADVTVFQSYEWCRTWWTYYSKPNFRLNIVLFIDHDRVVAVAPLFMDIVRVAGIRLASRLQFIGRSLSDYADVIIRRGYEERVLNSLAIHLRATSGKWDVFDSEDVNESSVVMKNLQTIMTDRGFTTYLYQGNNCPRIELPAAENMSPTNSYNFRRKLKKLKKDFTVDIELIQHETDDLRAAIDTFAEVHGRRWKSQGFWSAFDDEQVKAFHVAVSGKFARRGWLKLYVLKADGVPVAVSFHFNYNKRIYMYQSNAHGTDAIMKCSPGYLIRSLSIADGMKEGMEIFDFLRGDEAYKYTEANTVDSRNYLLRSSSPTWPGKMRFTMYLVYELLVKGRDRLKREYHEYLKFMIGRPRSFGEKLSYICKKLVDLFVLGLNFILRHAPIQSMQRLQIGRKTQGDHTGQNAARRDFHIQ